MILTRQQLEEREKKILALYTVKSAESSGRVYPEDEDDQRTCFQRDRDRIIHCKAFRRLEEKTQVFAADFGDHYRTRLTHTMEVAQVSRDLARTLGLNEDLAESIALAHDLGHPPFGHAGEYALSEVMREYGQHFEHNEQSLRIVEKLEKLYPQFDGLNLTKEVLDGLLKHRTPWDRPKMKFIRWPHLEGQVVDLADEIAYTNHDVDDGLRGNLFTLRDLSRMALWKKAAEEVHKDYGENISEDMLRYRGISKMIGLMIEDLFETTHKNLKRHKVRTLKDVQRFPGRLVNFSLGMRKDLDQLRRFLKINFYYSKKVEKLVEGGQKILKALFHLFMKKPEKLPQKLQDLIDRGEEKITLVKDYVAGMTDGYAEEQYNKLL